MARKSRRNQVGVSESVENRNGTASAETLATAAYARLSVENGGKENDESLQTQIALLHHYITESPFLKLEMSIGNLVNHMYSRDLSNPPLHLFVLQGAS